MKLVIEIGAHDGDDAVTHMTVAAFPLRIGRGYNNDIILPDPHINAHHADIIHNGTSWVLRDMGSENGCAINGKKCTGPETALRSGDKVTLGRTSLRIFDPQHPVPAVTRLEETSAFLRNMTKRLVAWEIFLAAVAVFCLLCYQEIWSDEPGSLLATAAGGAGVMMILWAAPWSVAGRLIRHRSYFHGHIAIAGLFIILSSLLWPLQSMINFLTNENPIATIFEYSYNFLLLSFLIYCSLSLATYMNEKRRLTMAMFFSGGFLGILFAFILVGTQSFNLQPVYPATLEPIFYDLPQAASLDGFISAGNDLFDSPALNIQTP